VSFGPSLRLGFELTELNWGRGESPDHWTESPGWTCLDRPSERTGRRS